MKIYTMAKRKSERYHNEAADDNSIPRVEEPVLAYQVKPANAPFLKKYVVLSVATRPESQMTALEKMDVTRSGISKKDLEVLKKRASLDYDDLAKALAVTRATLINKKNSEKFNPSLSERILSLADLYSYGYEVFEDEERFNQWMFKPNRALGGVMPYDLTDNQFGREEIRNIIGRIDYGVYS